eukprot:scaffold12152_cov52-Cyclotella_meneghiniana.AAC.7
MTFALGGLSGAGQYTRRRLRQVKRKAGVDVSLLSVSQVKHKGDGLDGSLFFCCTGQYIRRRLRQVNTQGGHGRVSLSFVLFTGQTQGGRGRFSPFCFTGQYTRRNAAVNAEIESALIEEMTNENAAENAEIESTIIEDAEIKVTTNENTAEIEEITEPADIEETTNENTVTVLDDQITFRGSGKDIWHYSDSFGFHHRTISGDFSIEIYVENLIGTGLHDWSKGGLMIRDSLTNNSKHFSLFVTGSNGLANQWRPNSGGMSSSHHSKDIVSRNVWLKLTKTGNKFQAYYKRDSSDNWLTFGLERSISLSETFYYGIAVSSHDTTKFAYLIGKKFSIVSVPNTSFENTTGDVDKPAETTESAETTEYAQAEPTKTAVSTDTAESTKSDETMEPAETVDPKTSMHDKSTESAIVTEPAETTADEDDSSLSADNSEESKRSTSIETILEDIDTLFYLGFLPNLNGMTKLEYICKTLDMTEGDIEFFDIDGLSDEYEVKELNEHERERARFLLQKVNDFLISHDLSMAVADVHIESSDDEDDSDGSSIDSVHSSNEEDVNDGSESEESSWDEGNDHLVAWVGNQKNPLTSIKMKKYLLKIFDEGEKMNQIMRDNGLIAFGDRVDDDKDDRRALVEKYS